MRDVADLTDAVVDDGCQMAKGLSQKHLSMYECCQSDIRCDVVEQALEALECRPNAFQGGHHAAVAKPNHSQACRLARAPGTALQTTGTVGEQMGRYPA